MVTDDKNNLSIVAGPSAPPPPPVPVQSKVPEPIKQAFEEIRRGLKNSPELPIHQPFDISFNEGDFKRFVKMHGKEEVMKLAREAMEIGLKNAFKLFNL